MNEQINMQCYKMDQQIYSLLTPNNFADFSSPFPQQDKYRRKKQQNM